MLTNPVNTLNGTLLACTLIWAVVALVRCWTTWKCEQLAYRERTVSRCSAHYEP